MSFGLRVPISISGFSKLLRPYIRQFMTFLYNIGCNNAKLIDC